MSPDFTLKYIIQNVQHTPDIYMMKTIFDYLLNTRPAALPTHHPEGRRRRRRNIYLPPKFPKCGTDRRRYANVLRNVHSEIWDSFPMHMVRLEAEEQKRSRAHTLTD